MKSFPAVFLAFPYCLLLVALRPWRDDPKIRGFARRSMDAFLWLNTFWVVCPVLLLIYFTTGELSWIHVAGLFIATALLFHSAIAHSTERILDQWESHPSLPHSDEM